MSATPPLTRPPATGAATSLPLDPATDDSLVGLATLASQICTAPIAIITLLEGDRRWSPVSIGTEPDAADAFITHALQHAAQSVITDAALDPFFADDPSVTGATGLRFCLSTPLTSRTGEPIGTLCVLDRVPRELAPWQLTGVGTLARQIASHLESGRQAQALAENERMLRAIVESEPECVKLLGRDGSLRLMNQAGLTMIEADAFDQVVGECLYPLVHPEFRSAFESLTARVFRGESGAMEFLITGLKGGERWLETHATPLRNEAGEITDLLGITRDITEAKAAVSALRESETRFRQLAENIREVFWMTDPATREMLYVSPAYETIWGRSCASLYATPRNWLDAVHPDDRPRVAAISDEKHMRGEYDETYRVVRPDGTIRWVHDRAYAVRNAAGEIYRIVGTAEDITARRQLEEKFFQSQKLEAVGQLAGGVAHDFNNLLTVIQGYASLLALPDESPEDVQDAVKQIVAASERAANLTRQLLAFSRRQVLQSKRVDLNDIITSLAKMLQRLLGDEIRMQLILHPRPLMTQADAGMLDQVLLNLIINARDAMPSGGEIVIETFERQLDAEEARHLTGASAGRHACLRVSDTGVGISPDDIARIFEPFFTTKPVGKGTGLGLATVFGIVSQHNGAVSVQSNVDQGATFEVFLPLLEAFSPPATVGSLVPGSARGSETILLAEDDPAVRRLTRQVLQRSGFTVLEAADGPDALQLWDRHEGVIDLLFTDLVMPGGMTGSELAKALRSRKPGLPVVLTSGFSAETAGREMSLADREHFLEKPASPAAIVETVRRCLDGRPPTGSGRAS
ncbi:MAG: PAS domain S-box protein [Gemmatimonadota bacterium]